MLGWVATCSTVSLKLQGKEIVCEMLLQLLCCVLSMLYSQRWFDGLENTHMYTWIPFCNSSVSSATVCAVNMHWIFFLFTPEGITHCHALLSELRVYDGRRVFGWKSVSAWFSMSFGTMRLDAFIAIAVHMMCWTYRLQCCRLSRCVYCVCAPCDSELPTTFFGSFDRDNYYEGYGAAVDDEVPLYPWLFNTACPNNKHADGPMTDVFIPNCDNPVYSKCEITDAMSANVRCQLP